ncbi:arylesterase [Planktosalinus lacus]|nr:arylesterase [Planktosalinus lacus]
MRTLLMFCYILMFTSVLSCGENQNKKSTPSPSETAESTSETTDSTASKTILFFGTSLTAGLGIDLKDAYPALIQQKIDSLGLNYQVINAGLSGETTASGKNRIDWVLNQKIDIFVLELGSNDGLRGVPLSETKKNLQEIINFVKEKNQDTQLILAGMEIPPNMGPEYTSTFRTLFPELATANDIYLIPFLLEDVGGVPELNQRDGIHPTEEGHQLMARNVWKVLKPILMSASE